MIIQVIILSKVMLLACFFPAGIQPLFYHVVLEIESAVNSIVSLVLYISGDQAEALISLFCESVANVEKTDKLHSLRLKLFVLRVTHGAC